MKAGQEPVRTLAEAIAEGAQRHADVRVVFDGTGGVRDTTVADLVADAERMAGALQGLGVQPGDVVAVQLASTYEGAVAQAAVALTGAVLLPIVLIYGPRELGFILRQSGAVALVLPDTHRGRPHAVPVLADLPALPSLHTVVVVGDAGPVEGALPFEELLGPLAKPYDAPELDEDARAMLVYTSGTTADPKGVQHTHRTLLTTVNSPAAGRRTSQLVIFPAGHIGGLLGLLRVLVIGCRSVVLEAWDPARAARLVDDYELEMGAGAPVMLAGLLDARDSGAADLASLREFAVGAAGVSPALIARAEAAGIRGYRAYGSSEVPTVSVGSPEDPLEKRGGTDGRLQPGFEVRILDRDGADLPAGSHGEIVVRAPAVFIGYTDATIDDTSFLPGRWFRTGDLGTLDADGYLTVTGRLKDIIIRGGENISAQEVEDVLGAHPAVAEVAALGVPDERMGERVCAAVVLRPGAALTLDDVRAHFIAAGTARQKTPERLELVDCLPRTPSGKVRKHVLREQLG